MKAQPWLPLVWPAWLSAIAAMSTALILGSVFPVPGRDGVVSAIYPLIPVLVGAALAHWVLEMVLWALVRHARRGLATWLFTVSVASLLPFLALSCMDVDVAVITVRNLLLAATWCILSCALFSEFAGQVSLFAFSAANWLLGTNLASPPDAWAVLLHSADGRSSLALAVIVFAGAFLFLRSAWTKGAPRSLR